MGTPLSPQPDQSMEVLKMEKKNIRIYKNRNYLNSKPLAHSVWNEHNPNNPWQKGYVIHHKDGNSLNDSIENLQLITKGKHNGIHHNKNKYNLGHKHSEESKMKMSLLQKGHIVLDKTKEKISEKLKGRKPSEEARKKMGIAKNGNKYNLGRKLSEEHKRKISESMIGNTNTLGYRYV